LVLILDAAGYLVAVGHVPKHNEELIALLADIFVVVAMLTIAVGLILPGMIAHSAVEVSAAAEKLVQGTLADFTRAMHALAAGDLDAAKARMNFEPVVVYSYDEVGDMAQSFNKLQEKIGHAAEGLDGARTGLLQSRLTITEINQRLREALNTASMALKDVETQKFALDEHAIVGITDIQGNIVYANDKFCEVSGYAREELLGQNHRIINSGHHPVEFFRELWATITGGQVWHGEIRNRKNDGSLYWVETTIVPFLGEDGKPVQFVSIRTNITERKNSQDALLTSLQDKEALLKEVHHRVKNNLQVITSLLRLESARIDYPATKNVLQDMQARIRSMSLLHESIYNSGNYAQVNLSYYLEQVTRQLFHSANMQPGLIKLSLKLVPLQLGIEQAILCGMIINELVSNSLKHGFPKGRAGEVCVELRVNEAEAQVQLMVSDNGVGLPADFKDHLGRSLGLQLVSDLTGQLKGSLEIEPGSNAVFTIEFAVPSLDLTPQLVRLST
ncbi:MAG: histidine kinase dimerization/phosphoacceptor domain -containing protein, partial [Gallionella sp.]